MRAAILFVILQFLQFSSWAAVEDLASRVRELKLSNGITALFVERHLSPTISFHIFYPIGSLEDEPGKMGLAHLFEHMMFKGTETVGTKDYAVEKKILDEIDTSMEELDRESSKGSTTDPRRLQVLQEKLDALNKEHAALAVPEEYWKIYERAGAEGMNASTGNDFTVYMVELPANKTELWMTMESDRLVHAVPREFYKERAVVMEERRLRVDTSPSGKLYEVFLRAAFGSHPYGAPVVGEMEEVAHLNRRDAMRFFHKYYRLSRAVVVIVGDFSTPSMEGLFRKYFEPLRESAPEEKIEAVPLPHFPDRPVTVEVPFEAEPEILAGYSRPAINHPDDAALEILADVLNMGRTSRLYRHLVEEKRIALGVDVWNSEPGERQPDLFVFDAVPRAPHTAQDCLRAIDEEIKKIKSQPPSSWEVEKVKNNIQAEFLRNLTSNGGLGWRLGYYQALLGNWHYLVDFLEQVKHVTPEDVTRVAKTYLDPQKRIIAIRVKKSVKS